MEFVDEQVLLELSKNAKPNMSKLAKALGVPLSTLYSKIKRMEKEGIIKNYSVNIDWKKIGYGVSAVVEVYIDAGRMAERKVSIHDIRGALLKIPNVEKVFLVTGRPDMVVFLRAKDNEHLGKIVMEQIQPIGGVVETRTHICFE